MRASTVLAALLGLAVAACDVGALFEPRPVDGGLFDGGPLEELTEPVPVGEPGAERLQWRAAVDATRRITGNLTASLPEGRAGALVLAFGNGLTYRLQQLGIHEGYDRVAKGGARFSELLGSVSGASVHLYQVSEERVTSVAPEGGLCGRERATAYVAVSEYLTEAGDWSFNIAAFTAGDPPGPAAASAEHFCGAYVYVMR